jgi:hypothetical protein
MELYTLDYNFRKREIIDQFSSVIWTERYSTEGDVQLVVDATPEMISELVEGTFLAQSNSKEIMLLETQDIVNGKLTVTGNTLIAFLKERIIRTEIAHEIRYWPVTGSPGQIIADIVQEMCIGGAYLLPGALDNVDSVRAIIPNLSIGDVDTLLSSIDIAVPFGQVYDVIKPIAETYKLGMSLYLDSATEDDYSLIFKTYNGRNLTSDQTTYPIVRFSSILDSLTNAKELNSIAGYKNVVYAYAPSLEGLATEAGVAFANSDSETSVGFNRRILMLFCDDITTDEIGASGELLQSILNQRARDALANNNYTRVVDGEVVPQSEFKYGNHYGLGDIIELQGHSGLTQKARITEYIQSQDSSGERAYPTVSVIL